MIGLPAYPASLSRRLASSMFRFHLKLLEVSQSVPGGAQVSIGMPNPKVASFMIASLSKDRAMALRTRGSEVGANWVFNTNCFIPAAPMDT